MPDEFSELISHLTDNARTSLHHANLIAQSYGSPYIGTEHLLLGILAQGSSFGAKLLADAGVTLEQAQSVMSAAPITVVITNEPKALSETAKLSLRLSWEVAQDYGQDYLGTEHILYSILSQKNSRAIVILSDLNINVSLLKANIEEFLSNGDDDGTPGNNDDHRTTTATLKKPKVKGILGVFGTDLTDLAKDNRLDPVIGRKTQEDRLITILSRRTKNNPVLIGEPGVGKTAIVEGLAQRIVNEDVPAHLLDSRIIQLDLAGMIAGTKYRGEFEDRMKKVLEEIKKRKHTILFIDELHLLAGAGAAEGSIDAANMLKPALAKGEIHLIGATTLDEYRKHIEKDSALERRFQTIIVPEPSDKDSVAILKGLKERYEKHHGVIMSDEVISDAVYMASRYISERFMPDKAIDVIDEASATARVKSGRKPSKLRDYSKQLKLLNDKMEEAVSGEDYEKAALYKTKISQISTKIAEMRLEADNNKPIELTSDDVAAAVATMTGIPVQRLQKSEAKMLVNLEKYLGRYVVGQEEAVTKVAKAIRRSRSGVASSDRPIGSFVFMGPTGVGKTELARVLAREVFGSEDALIKIDMSEFSEKHTTSRLVGAPAGYVGYDDGGQLTDKIRRQPYSVVLFDEIEKAHPGVFNILLQILEDGTLTDAKGRQVSFKNAIIILTSNVGADMMMRESSLGFHASSADDHKKLEEIHDENAEAAEEALSKLMRPELINRFDGIITFRALTSKQISQIFDVLIEDLKARLAQKGIHIVVKSKAKKFVIKKGYSEKFGARPLRRVIQDEIEHPIADGLLSGKFNKGDVLNVSLDNSQVVINVATEE